MSQYLDIAQQHLLTPVGMEISDLQKTLGQIMTHSIDQADLYFESSRSESWVMEEGIIKEGSHNIQQGMGVRAISGEKTGFAYSDEILLSALTSAAKAARAIASSGTTGSLQAWNAHTVPAMYINSDPTDSISSDKKIALLKKLDDLGVPLQEDELNKAFHRFKVFADDQKSVSDEQIVDIVNAAG